MEKEYTRTFSIAKLYELIKGDTPTCEVSPFETYKISKPFNRFCEVRLPQSPKEHDNALFELIEVFQAIEENAFCVGFRMALNLMR